jgi:uncharacterized membrane protein YcaP (DUF421 family)
METLYKIGQIALVSLWSVAAMYLIARLIGHRQISQLGVFDYINGITIGSIAAEMATELEDPWRPFTAIVVYGVAVWLISVVMQKRARLRRLIDGEPAILMDGGKLYRENMKKARLDLSEFLCLCRQAGYFDLSEIQTAVFENTGTLTILPVSGRRPATPDDLGLSPAPAHIMTEVIMDGRVLSGNLSRMGLDEKWLLKQLSAQGYAAPSQIFLGQCDVNRKLSLYKKTDRP